MSADFISKALVDSCIGQFSCTNLPNSAVQVTTPLLYPDRTMIDVYVLADQGAYAVTDFGEALGWLWTRRGIDDLTKRQYELLDHIQRTSGVAFANGRLRVDCPLVDDLPSSIYSVAQTALRVADLWFSGVRRTKRAESEPDPRETVEKWLTSQEFQFTAGSMAEGRSGRQWPIDFQVAGAVPSLIQWVNVENQRAATPAINAAYAAFGDIKRSANGIGGIRRVALFNDSLPYWQRADYRLIEEVAVPAKWSDPDGLEEILRASAP